MSISSRTLAASAAATHTCRSLRVRRTTATTTASSANASVGPQVHTTFWYSSVNLAGNAAFWVTASGYLVAAEPLSVSDASGVFVALGWMTGLICQAGTLHAHLTSLRTGDMSRSTPSTVVRRKPSGCDRITAYANLLPSIGRLALP